MRGNSIAVDLSGNVYTTGRFKGSADFDPGPGDSHFISKGKDEFYIQKLNPDGQLVWALIMGAQLTDHGHCIAVDAESNIYTTGTFQGTVDFDGGKGSFNLKGRGGNDMFVQKIKQ